VGGYAHPAKYELGATMSPRIVLDVGSVLDEAAALMLALVVMAMGASTYVILWIRRRSIASRQSILNGTYCVKCGYNLAMISMRCPECGNRFGPGFGVTSSPPPQNAKWVSILLLSYFCIIVAGILLLSAIMNAIF
jgi:hypothetical protein